MLLLEDGGDVFDDNQTKKMPEPENVESACCILKHSGQVHIQHHASIVCALQPTYLLRQGVCLATL